MMKGYQTRFLAGMLVISLFAMCTKSAVEKPASSLSNLKAVTADAANTDADNDTYTVQPNQWFVDGANIAPGTTIYIPAGVRGALLFKNLRGTAADPIIITNSGGKVTFLTSTSASYAFKTQNCQYFKVLGNGTPGLTYGFDVNGGNIGMTMDDLSSDFEIYHVEVHNSGFAGIMAKTDPTCDPLTWRGHFKMKNVVIRYNWIHKTGGEGLYIGNSFYEDGVSGSCGTLLPHDVVNVSIYRNRVDSTGCEGIQVGSAITGCKVHNNTIRFPGLSPFASGQNNGIQIGEGTGGTCYANYVYGAPGNGIIVLGLGDNLVYSNVIVNSGANGIFSDSRFTPGLNFKFINNTIINSGADGIKMNSELIPMNTVINNVIVGSGSGVAVHKISPLVKLTTISNYITNDIDDCGFVNPDTGDYHLLSSSPLINAGANTLLYGVTTDYYGIARQPAGNFDIGAAEF